MIFSCWCNVIGLNDENEKFLVMKATSFEWEKCFECKKNKFEWGLSSNVLHDKDENFSLKLHESVKMICELAAFGRCQKLEILGKCENPTLLWLAKYCYCWKSVLSSQKLQGYGKHESHTHTYRGFDLTSLLRVGQALLGHRSTNTTRARKSSGARVGGPHTGDKTPRPGPNREEKETLWGSGGHEQWASPGWEGALLQHNISCACVFVIYRNLFCGFFFFEI